MRMLRRGMRASTKALLLSLPAFILFFIFYILPLFMTAYYSCVKSAFDLSFVGVSNYVKVLSNKYFRLAAVNTALFSLCAVPLCWGMAFFLALCMDKLPRYIGLFAAFLLLPMVLPSSAVVPIWQMLFPASDSAFFAILVLFLWKYTGFAALLLLSGIRTVPVSCLEAARLDGASSRRVITSVLLPVMSDQAFFVLMLVLVYSFRIFKECYLLYGAYPPDQVYLLQHYINNHFYKLNYQNMTVAAVCMLLLIALIALFWLRGERRREEMRL